jgi:hypothetical protein
MATKIKRDRYYQRILRECLIRHAKDINSKPMNSFVKEIDWSKLDNFLKIKNNEQDSRTNDSGS